ncbi:hypothetical protein V6N13_057114 [Hibiscus sabdariffa]|uniref:Uncharacterized protein n=2 Tax=Hibiscus sabdariffa TaxID=183260 RepID=A0ABR2AEE9_9ROSI
MSRFTTLLFRRVGGTWEPQLMHRFTEITSAIPLPSIQKGEQPLNKKALRGLFFIYYISLKVGRNALGLSPDQDPLLLSLPMLLRPVPQPPTLIDASWGDCSLWQQGAQELTIGMLRAPDPRGTRDDDGSTATGAAGGTAASARISPHSGFGFG